VRRPRALARYSELFPPRLQLNSALKRQQLLFERVLRAHHSKKSIEGTEAAAYGSQGRVQQKKKKEF
jgi:hypothetical protein